MTDSVWVADDLVADLIVTSLNAGDLCCISDLTEKYGQVVSDRICRQLKLRGLDVYDGFVMTQKEIRERQNIR